MEGLETLSELDTLNLANNLIKKIEGLEKNEKVTSLTLSHNFLQSKDDIEALLDCQNITYYIFI